jgi:hypothetical protein
MGGFHEFLLCLNREQAMNSHTAYACNNRYPALHDRLRSAEPDAEEPLFSGGVDEPFREQDSEFTSSKR